MDNFEAIPTPGYSQIESLSTILGHCPGSTCFLWTPAGGKRVLFSGDTIYLDSSNNWAYTLKFHPYPGNQLDMSQSLKTLLEVDFDVLIPSIYEGTEALQEVSPNQRRQRILHLIQKLEPNFTPPPMPHL
jgi:glyoxylase-like metal-dependent hydrolase (beta-lactamase superfamily II)